MLFWLGQNERNEIKGLEHRTVRDSEDELLEILDRDGGVIIEGILNNEDLEQVRSDLSSYIDASPTGENLFWGFQTKRNWSVDGPFTEVP